MKIFLDPPPRTYLFFVVGDEDAKRLAEYSVQSEIEYTKIGDKTFVGLFHDTHETVDAQLREKLGLTDKLLWFQLPYPELTH